MNDSETLLLLATSLLGGLGLFTLDFFLFNGLDDTDGNGLSHVTDSESTEWWVLLEGFDAHWLNIILKMSHINDIIPWMASF